MAITLATRIGNVQPFLRVHSREDERYGGLQAGLTTYHETKSGDEEYRTTYMEWGGRSDHLTIPVASAMDKKVEPLLSSDVSSEDADYVRQKKEDKEEKATSKPDLKVA